MKRMILFLMWAFMLCSCSALISCGNSNDDVINNVDPTPIPTPSPQPSGLSEDSVLVHFNLGGEIKNSEEPLSRVGGENDLYSFNIYQTMVAVPDTSGVTSFTPYAYGYFDDLNSIVLKLAKNRYYHVEMAYIPDGKLKVHQFSDGHYGNPCEVIYSKNIYNGKLNEVVYSTENSISNMDVGTTQAKGIEQYGFGSNLFNGIDRYQGLRFNFHPTETVQTLNINLFRMMTGVKLIVRDFKEGIITVSSRGGYEYTLKPATDSDTNVLDIVVECPAMPTIQGSYDYSIINNEQPFSNISRDALNITYTDKSGDIIPLYSSRFAFKRMTRHVFEFSLSDAITNGGITANIKEETNDDLKDEQWDW